MRPLEILIVFANLLAFLIVAVPRFRAIRWTASIIFIAPLITIAQLLWERPRWQMLPAYVLTGLFLLVWIGQRTKIIDGISRWKIPQRIIAGIALTLGALSILFSTLLPAILPVFGFPHPTGPYEIGTVTYHWTDTSRREVFSSDEKTRRELMVQVWYPARQAPSAAHAPYLQDADTITPLLASLHRLPYFSLTHFRYVTTNAFTSAPPANDHPSYPVLIFLEGLTGYRQMSTFQVEELVSHGYIVVGIDQPGAAINTVFPDGHQIPLTSELLPQVQALVHQSLTPSQNTLQLNGQTFKDGIIPYFAQDASFVLDQLALLNVRDPLLRGKMDLEHAGAFGMSLGGMVSAQACLQDPRLKACLIMDVAMTADVVEKGLQQPAMWITRPADDMRLERQKAGGWAEKDIIQTQETMREVYTRSPGAGYFVQIPGTFHVDFTDINLISPISPLFGFGGSIGSQRAHTIINAYSVAFFDKHLKGRPEALLDHGQPAQFPEVIYEKN